MKLKSTEANTNRYIVKQTKSFVAINNIIYFGIAKRTRFRAITWPRCTGPAVSHVWSQRQSEHNPNNFTVGILNGMNCELKGTQRSGLYNMSH